MGPPNLIQIQSGSFDWFQDQGIRDLLEEISPIQDSMREGISADIAKGRTPRQILAMLKENDAEGEVAGGRFSLSFIVLF